MRLITRCHYQIAVSLLLVGKFSAVVNPVALGRASLANSQA